jgi:hypothetical protein
MSYRETDQHNRPALFEAAVKQAGGPDVWNELCGADRDVIVQKIEKSWVDGDQTSAVQPHILDA